MSVPLKNHNFTIRFSVSVLSFFSRNSCFSLIYTKNLGICVRTTEKLSTLLICIKSLNVPYIFQCNIKYYGEILWSLVICSKIHSICTRAFETLQLYIMFLFYVKICKFYLGSLV